MSARSLNKVQLIGNLTRDPEMKYTPNGSAVCTFGIATNRSWTPSDGGETQEETEFHRIVAWGKLAEICSQLLFKGRKVFVEGRLQTRRWTGNDNVERQTTEIVIDSMIALSPPKSGFPDDYNEDDDFSSSNNEQETASSSSSSAEENPKKTAKKDKQQEEVDIDDIPF